MIMKRFGKYMAIGLLVLLFGCQEVFEPDVEEVDPFLVVEAMLTTRPGVHTVILTTSSSFNQGYSAYGRIVDAVVYVEDDLGRRRYYLPVNKGVYQTDKAEPFAAELARTYTLTVILNDGTRFQSSPQTVVPVPDVKNLFCNYEEQTILTENVYEEVLELPYDGINVLNETDGILEANNYYFYKWRAYEQHFSAMRIGITEYYLYHHRPLSGKYSTVLSIGNADEFGNFALRNNKLFWIMNQDMFSYFPPVEDTLAEYVYTTQFQGLLFRLEQYSLTPDAYSFWNDAEAQLEAGGKLFDPVTPQLHGNVRCVSDSLTKVIGIFSVSDRKDKYAYFFVDGSNRTYTQEIDSFPEIFLDSIQYSRPSDWITPPY